MPQTQNRKCSVSFGELISFLSIFLPGGSSTMGEAYSFWVGWRLQKKRVMPSSSTTTLSFTPAFSASRSSNWRGSSMGSCDRRNVP
jgi:hypothetical protein